MPKGTRLEAMYNCFENWVFLNINFDCNILILKLMQLYNLKVFYSMCISYLDKSRTL